MQAASIGTGDGKQPFAYGDFFPTLRQATKFLADQATDGVGFFIRVRGVEGFVEVFALSGGIDTETLWIDGKDLVFAVIQVKFVFNVAHDLFRHIF